MTGSDVPIFVINLARSGERRARVQEAFGALGVAVRFFPAVDGRAIDLKQSPLYDSATRVARYGADLESAEIGCYLSHLSVMQHCLEEGIERAIILEDDVEPSALFAESAAQLTRAPDCFELVRLFGVRKRRALPVCRVTSKVNLTWPTHGLCGSQGYYLTAAAMRKILASGKITVPYDMMLDRYWRHGVTIFALSPYVITHEEQASDIGVRRDLWADGSHQLLRARLKLGKVAERVSRSAANLARRLQMPAWRAEGVARFSVMD